MKEYEKTADDNRKNNNKCIRNKCNKNELYTTEVFNHTLNHSTSLVSRMERFETYRSGLTQMMCQAFANSHQLYVLAAGNLADVDYSVLFQRLDLHQVILSDIDLESMQEGLLMYETDGVVPQISFEAYNYLGAESDVLIADFIEQFNRMANRQVQDRDIYTLIDALIEQICDNMDHISVSQTVDAVLVLPIYTQLLYIHLDAVLYLNPHWKACHLYCFEQMTKVIQAFNKYLLRLSVDDSRMIIVSDIVQISPEEGLDLNAVAKQDGNISRSGQIESYLNQYEEKYGIGLGSYGLLHMESCRTLIHNDYLEWPFDENRTFLVRVGIF